MNGIWEEDQPTLAIEDSTDLLILLLYAPGKSAEPGDPVVGTTRLQKLMFLLQQGEGPQQIVSTAKELGYRPYKMGPFSDDLRETVQELIAARIIEVQRLEYTLPDDTDASAEASAASEESDLKKVESYKYSLTRDHGMQIGRALWEGTDRDLQQALAEFKSFFNELSLRQLLIFTYEKFPVYTEQSTIKDQLGY